MASPFPSFLKRISLLLSWIPLLVFFTIIIIMFLNDFPNAVDEYFVRLVLRSCLILLFATGITQIAVVTLLVVLQKCVLSPLFFPLRRVFYFLNSFPILETGIFSVAIFFRSPAFDEWVYFIAVLLTFSTLHYWSQFFNSSLKKIKQTAQMHEIHLGRVLQVLVPQALTHFVDYFFIILKRGLLSFVFILVVMDFKIILPRLVDAGMSYQSYIMFLSLIISLHLLSYKEELQ